MTIPPGRAEIALDVMASALILASAAMFHRAITDTRPVSTDIQPTEGGKAWADPAALPPNRPAGVVRLLFAGDVMQHARQARDHFPDCYRNIAGIVSKADLAVCNMEFPVHPDMPVGPKSGTVEFNGSPAHVRALVDTGFDVMVTANNHCFDQGIEGVGRTIDAVSAAGAQAAGTAMSRDLLDVPGIFRAGSLRVGLAAYTYAVNWRNDEKGKPVYPPPDLPVHDLDFFSWDNYWRERGTALFRRHARSARDAGAEFVIAYCHWGREWHFSPDSGQVRAARDMIDAGFDLVVGSHPHVLQGGEVYRGKLISYSLGNLVSDFRPSSVRTGALLSISLSGPPNPTVVAFEYLPTYVDLDGHRVLPLRSGDSGPGAAAFRLAQRILGPAVADWPSEPGDRPPQ